MLSDLFVNHSLVEANRVAMPKINQAGLARILVAVPPSEEQDRIALRIDHLMSLCDRLEVAHREREALRRRLLDGLLHSALNEPPQSQQ
jgi:type I restriction enzyme S subunit